MKRLSIFGLMLALASSAHAQQVIDGSDKGFEPDIVNQIVARMQPKNSMPRKVVLRDLRRSKADPRDICGSVTVEDRYGTYPDFEPFIIYAGTLHLINADQCQ